MIPWERTHLFRSSSLEAPDREAMLQREAIANRPKHWVRLVTACNNRCLFCLDMDTPGMSTSVEDIQADLRRGREELDAWKVILSGGEASASELRRSHRYAHSIGYGRVQTVTNGMLYGIGPQATGDGGGSQRDHLSLHGHTLSCTTTSSRPQEPSSDSSGDDARSARRAPDCERRCGHQQAECRLPAPHRGALRLLGVRDRPPPVIPQSGPSATEISSSTMSESTCPACSASSP